MLHGPNQWQAVSAQAGLTEVTTDTTDRISSPHGSVPTVLSPQFAFEHLGSFI